ncbi:hypothetical protein PRIPAC_95779, partial [Pristionchus pacificus]|uniref:Uncharacterized protein n=1 Tax=Pristionchus pacificus TaxID=54126 RepID=A0A2A6B332_PRIPA
MPLSRNVTRIGPNLSVRPERTTKVTRLNVQDSDPVVKTTVLIDAETYVNDLRLSWEKPFVALFSNYSEISAGSSTHFYIALKTLELLTIIYSILVFSLSASHIFQIFHTNFISPLLCFYAQTYIFTFARVVLSMYQNGLIELG